MSAPKPWSAFDAAMAKMDAHQAMMDAERVAMLARAERIRRRRKATLCIGFAILALVTLALPIAEARIDAWAAHEEAKAAQAYRRTP